MNVAGGPHGAGGSRGRVRVAGGRGGARARQGHRKASQARRQVAPGAAGDRLQVPRQARPARARHRYGYDTLFIAIFDQLTYKIDDIFKIRRNAV